MENDIEEFEQQLFPAMTAKTEWFNKVILAKVHDDYRLHHTCVTNLLNALIKKSLIAADPYKHDKKISGIVCPPDTEFTENERSLVLGTRLSDYESMLDFICNYINFTVEQITLDKIRKMTELNNTINWGGLNLNSPKQNTRALASIIVDIRTSSDNLTVSLVNDCISKAKKSLQDITAGLKQLAEFQREVFKVTVRKEILNSSQCNRKKTLESSAEMQTEVRRLFPQIIGKKPYYSDLVDEIYEEDAGDDRQKLRATLLGKLNVEKKVVQKKENVIDTKEMLADLIHMIGSMSEMLMLMRDKIEDNYDILENENDNFMQSFFKQLRKLLGIKNPPVDYEVLITDHVTGIQHKERIHYNDFLDSLNKRIKIFTALLSKSSQVYIKLMTKEENYIIDYLSKNITETNTLFGQLSALDEFFKEAASPENKPRIRGIKMELTTLKNAMVKTNQKRAEYVSYIEEKEQMKKLGISD